jgi:hypothetical protein
MTMTLCILCLDDYPADLVVAGTCYLCREALDPPALVLDPPDAEAAWELAAHYDATRVDPAEYACTPVVEVDVYAYETGCEARGEW